MDIGAQPVKQIIICGCEAKFQDEADLKVHLNLYHKGDTEVKVRVQKVYLSGSPNSINGISDKPTSYQKSTQNTNVQIQKATVHEQNSIVQKQNTVIQKQNPIVPKQKTFVSKKLTSIENQIQKNHNKNKNVTKSVNNLRNNKSVSGPAHNLQYPSTVVKSPKPIVINKRSIIPNTGTQHFAVFRTGDNTFIVKNNMFNANGVNVIPVNNSNVKGATASRVNVQATWKHVQATPKNVQLNEGEVDHYGSKEIHDTEYQSAIDGFEQEIVQDGNEIIEEGNGIAEGMNEVIISNVKSEVEIQSEVITGDLKEESTASKDEPQPNGISQFIKAGPNVILVKGAGSQEQFHYCDLCGKTFEKERGLRYHKSRYHKEIVERDVKDTAALLYKCSMCDRAYNCEASLHMHRTNKHGFEPQRNSRKGRFKCGYCEKAFVSKTMLHYHERNHTGERPHQCPYCDKKFTVYNYLNYHIRVHTNERPYPCEVCDKRFKSQTNLMRHRMVHTGEQPYTCPNCGKSFNQSNAVKVHILTVHLKQPSPYKSQSRLARQEERARRKARRSQSFNQTEAV